MNRAYSMLTVKAVDDDQRVITGLATSPAPDRMGDVVEPLGVKYRNPMPLLWQHRASEPVGTVRFDKPTKDGITFEAKMPKVEEPGRLKDRIDEAWQSVKLGLVRAVSIGFRAIEMSFMDDGGIHFLESEVLELSLVTIPAQADAKIETIKSIDAPLLAATGLLQTDADRPKPPGATGSRKPVKLVPKEAKSMKKTITEQISGFEATRAAKAAEMDKIMDEAAEKGETLDAEQKKTYDDLNSEVKEIDEHLVRLRAREESNKTAAVVVNGKDIETASASRGGSVVSMKRNVPKGIPFVRLLQARYLGMKHQRDPADIAKQWTDTPEVEMVLRAAVSAGTTTHGTFAAPLVVAENLASEFADLLAPATIIGRIPGLTRVPFNIKVPRLTTGASVNWVGEGRVKPVSSMAFDSLSLAFNKVAGIVPITEELMRFSNPAAEGIIRDSLVSAIAQLTDRDFLDPSKAAVANVSPASLTRGVTPITASGTAITNLQTDLGALLDLYFAQNMSTAGLVLVMTSRQASRIGMMRNSLGQTVYPDLGPSGGTLEQIPVITSENIVNAGGSPGTGSLIVAINAPEVLLADDGGVDLAVSTEASIQMDSAPDSPATASTVTVSAFQYNMVFIRAERYITWTKRRSGAVQYINAANYK